MVGPNVIRGGSILISHARNGRHRRTVAPRTGDEAVSYRTLFQIAHLRGLLLAALLARLAERMFGLVLVLYVLDRFHSPQLAGWVGFSTLAPGLTISPLAGALLDRAGPACGIATDMTVSACCILGLALLDLAGNDGATSVLGLAALYSLTNPLSAAGVRTLLPSVVPRAARSKANAVDTTIHAVVDVCGPAIAGALVGFAGAVPALLTIAALYAAGCATLLPSLRALPPARRMWRNALLAEAAAGVAHVVRHPSLRPLAIGYAAYNMGWGILLVAVPVFVLRATGGGAHGDLLVGGLWAASGMAAAVGALLVGHYAAPGRERALMMAGMAATAVSIWPIGALFGLAGLASGLVLVGMLAGPVDVSVLTLRQHRTDPAWLGRVMAVSMSLNLSGAPIGLAVGGALLGWSVQAAFVAAASMCAVGALALRWVPRC
ncbi:MAG TPA: MFS transporter [Acetobacteraceae bacterium]|nr:MFS transporter [Acetobacteraceae bacterium]